MRTFVAVTALTVAGILSSDVGAEESETAFAVVELFTSEGCSSCPPAEALLNALHAQAEEDGVPIYALAFHVDYWNRLGWTDPFSDRAYSQRQRDYAVALRERSVYTPQMIVNGTEGFVGSDRHRAQQAITRALQRDVAVTVGVEISPQWDENGTLRALALDIDIDGADGEQVVNVAVVEDGLSTDVPRGENRGRTLRHDAVVRGFQTLPVTSVGEMLVIDWPRGVDPDEAAVVVYVQDPATRRVSGAKRVALAESEDH